MKHSTTTGTTFGWRRGGDGGQAVILRDALANEYYEGPREQAVFFCQHCGFKGQKHRLNLHRHHGLCRAEVVKGVRLKNYRTIP
jgi:hypothetical protein